MSTYARNTRVTSGSSRIEIESTLRKFGATDIITAELQGKAVVVFKFRDKTIRFTKRLPDSVRTPRGRKPHNPSKALDQAVREAWRGLLLRLKSKVATTDIEEFEIEFQPYFVTPDGRTVGEILRAQIEKMYKTGKLPPAFGIPLELPSGDSQGNIIDQE
jgi:hypothetical protein